ncbi:hypothetical protein [Amycolatopsis sp. WQ 127309]|uniref:pPIWI_RE_Y domain-containing protein n=1 Tax=Amycolatopsis sp. WQ 127309 TaxID=2932773 RepID=UPI001FF36794|nr:hypothetical protein [Amycolatopsis sp. WQ 127309]UOZ07025.1 hypothetical protein MUY22_01650 [Amycolatopsis sp. WQ 127309]
MTTLLHHLARGIDALSSRDSSSPSVPPYPDDTQYALDLVVRECLDHERTPPAGVPELVRWCTDLTSKQWPHPPAHPGVALVDPVHRIRTRACAELAGVAATADALMADALSDLSEDEAAERLRFLESHVLVGPGTPRELLMKSPKDASIFKSVKALYRPVPAEWAVRGRVALCECGLPARLDDLADEVIVRCERETCPPGAWAGPRLQAGRALLLHTALRLFVALPATLDDRVRGGLVSEGLPMRTSDPATRRHEVRFPGCAPITFRCYDRIVASALAGDATADRVDVAVVPDRSPTATPVARQEFTDALPPGSLVILATESELLSGATNDRKDA